MVLEDSQLQKSMQINEKRVRKQGSKKVCGIERKNGAKMEPTSEPEIVNVSKNTKKKASLKRREKKVPNGTAKKLFLCRLRGAWVLISVRRAD